MKVQLRQILPLFLLFSGASARAQFHFFEALSWQRIEQPPNKAVIADITSTISAPTPWGSFTQTETGKYWRSRNGKVRQDDAHGLSTVVDLGSNPRSLTYIDHELQRIWTDLGKVDRRSRHDDATGADFEMTLSTKAKKVGRDVVEGFKITIRKGELLHFPKGAPSGWTYEIWTSDELKMILVFKLQHGTDEFVQRYHNLRLEEPDPSIFQLPNGFHIVKISTMAPRCFQEETGVTGEPKSIEVTRPCVR